MDPILREQIDYYRARADQYDDWWLRRGEYELPPDLQARWFDDVAEVEQALHHFAPAGRVLELACGTGLWTRHLVTHADQVTAIDASPEVIEINKARTRDPRVEYVVDDVFTWRAVPAAYDSVVFGYWLSHVPDSRLAAFWSGVESALKAGGRVFLVDSAAYPPSGPPAPGGRPEQRRLHDGRTFHIAKRYWRPAELEEFLAGLGWQCEARLTGNDMILYAEVRPGRAG